MSSQPWVWDAATNQYAWKPETVAPRGQFPNPSNIPKNSASAHAAPYSQEQPTPGLTASDVGGIHAYIPHGIYPPSAFSYYPPEDTHGPRLSSIPAQRPSNFPQSDPPSTTYGPTFVPNLTAGPIEIPQKGRHTKRSPSPAFPYALPPPSPPPAPALPASVPPQQQHDIFLPPPSPPPTYAQSSKPVRCHCCLRNPVSFRELGVSWCAECFEMVQSRRQR